MMWSFKTSARRTETRKLRREGEPSTWERLQAQGVLPSLGIAAGFCVIVSAILLLREDVAPYRPGQYVGHDITSRVDFKFFDQDNLLRLQEQSRQKEPRIYRRTDHDALKAIEEELLALPDRIHGKTREQLDPPLSDVMTSGALTLLEQYRQGLARSRYAEAVHQFIGDTRQHLPPVEGQPLVIIDQENWQKDAGRRIALVSKGTEAESLEVDATRDTYPATLSPAVESRLEGYAKVFELNLAPSLAQLTYKRLSDNPTYELDDAATAAARNAAGDKVPRDEALRPFQRNMVIVRAGNISEYDYQVLRTENQAYHKSLGEGSLGIWKSRLGIILLAAATTILLAGYVARYQARVIRNHTRAISMGALLASMLLLTQLAGIGGNWLYVFGVGPTIVAAMILTIAYDQRLAIGISTIQSVLVAIGLNQGMDFFLVLWVGVLMACYLLDDVRSRSKLIEIGGACALAMMIVVAAAGFVAMNPIRFIALDALAAGAAGLGAGFVVLGTLPFIEKTFRITTSMTLLELADASHPLLRRLALEAPGTYNHSLQVATLAEAAAESITVNSLACRVGAYYHDIGKIHKAEYFVENQFGGPSRHLNLSPNVSLLIIIGHVKDGIELAREYNLPTSLLHFIQQHHGTTLVEYFYHQARTDQEARPDEQQQISDTQYRYPGPKPRSKEVAVVMMADCVESAARAMPEPTASRLEALVHELALKRLLDTQFDECDLTMRDLELIEKSLVKTLLGIYHGRIAYPTSPKNQTPPAPAPSARSA